MMIFDGTSIFANTQVVQCGLEKSREAIFHLDLLLSCSCGHVGIYVIDTIRRSCRFYISRTVAKQQRVTNALH